MSDRLRSDFWVSAYLRRCAVADTVAVLRRRGAAEAGAILIKVDRLDGTGALYGPAPQTAFDGRPTDRLFIRLHGPETLTTPDLEARIASQLRYDPDLWVIEVEDRAGVHRLDLAEP